MADCCGCDYSFGVETRSEVPRRNYVLSVMFPPGNDECRSIGSIYEACSELEKKAIEKNIQDENMNDALNFLGDAVKYLQDYNHGVTENEYLQWQITFYYTICNLCLNA